MRVERGAGRLRILGDKLQVAERRDQRDHEGDEEWQPHHPTDLVGHLPGERIDAGAQNITNDEEQQEPGAHHSIEAGFGFSGRPSSVQGEIGHRSAPRSVASFPANSILPLAQPQQSVFLGRCDVDGACGSPFADWHKATPKAARRISAPRAQPLDDRVPF